MKFIKWLAFILGWIVLATLFALIVDGVIPFCWSAPFSGPITALVLLSYTFFFSPGNRRLSIIITFFLGSLLAWLSGVGSYPECHKLAYEPAPIALFLTVGTGLAYLVVLCVVIKSRVDRPVT